MRVLELVLLVFSVIVTATSFANAESKTHPIEVSRAVAEKLKSGHTFPVEVDMFTTLKDVKGTSGNEVTYYYTTLFDDARMIEEQPILDYACSNRNYKTLYEKGFSIVFTYSSTEGKELKKVSSSKEICKK